MFAKLLRGGVQGKMVRLWNVLEIITSENVIWIWLIYDLRIKLEGILWVAALCVTKINKFGPSKEKLIETLGDKMNC